MIRSVIQLRKFSHSYAPFWWPLDSSSSTWSTFPDAVFLFCNFNFHTFKATCGRITDWFKLMIILQNPPASPKSMIHAPAHNRFVCVLDFNKLCIWILSNLLRCLPFSLSLCHPPSSVCLFLFWIRGGGVVIESRSAFGCTCTSVPELVDSLLLVLILVLGRQVGLVGGCVRTISVIHHLWVTLPSSHCSFFLRISPIDSMCPVIHFCSSGPNPPVLFYFNSCLPLHSKFFPRDPQTWLFLSSNAFSAHAVWLRFGSNFLGHLHQRQRS